MTHSYEVKMVECDDGDRVLILGTTGTGVLIAPEDWRELCRRVDAALAECGAGEWEARPEYREGDLVTIDGVEQRITEVTKRALRFADALVQVMDGTQDHDIQGETGLSREDCEKIAAARADAQSLLSA